MLLFLFDLTYNFLGGEDRRYFCVTFRGVIFVNFKSKIIIKFDE